MKCHRSFPVICSEIAIQKANCSEMSNNVLQQQIMCLQMRFVQWCKLWVQRSSHCLQELFLHHIWCSFLLTFGQIFGSVRQTRSYPRNSYCRSRPAQLQICSQICSNFYLFLSLSVMSFTSFGQNKISRYSITCHGENILYSFLLPISGWTASYCA